MQWMNFAERETAMADKRSDATGVSATRASAILGLNQWKTPLLAWQEVMEHIEPGFNASRGFILPEREDKAVFRWGHAFEDSLITLAKMKTGERIADREMMVSTTGGKPNAFAKIDGRYSTHELHEGKTTNFRAFDLKWGEPGTDRIPQEYQVQVQHQMMCADAEKCIVSVLVFPRPVDDWEDEGWTIMEMENGSEYRLIKTKAEGTPSEMNIDSVVDFPVNWASTLNQMGYFHQYPVESKPDQHKLLMEAYEHFWGKYVLTKTPPEIDDYEDVRRTFTAPKGTLVVSDDAARWMREYRDINREIGSGGNLKKRKDYLKTKILKFAKDKTTVADNDSQEKIVFRDNAGNKVGSFNGTTFRA